ncbi:cysteine--tRNA ligase [Roseovarius salinarum]|uniref:cysteine--tRNA ligase n=1 Tax=Roseovarius salinarum TaxID=1981892 RepID=UPI000C346872|nr:cysteine--tRNA ligase [Roseovarius salinarum]
MTTITLYNTRTRRKETFTPLDPDNVRMYVCGPTVYDRAHLGNARPVIVFDVLFRLLRHVYGAGHVTYVRNITDVDDKINKRAQDSGRPISEITEETTRWYLEDMGALGALEPDHMPRATDYIPQMIAMIETLIERGCAYEAEGHVLFDVESYDAYGALSGRSVDDMIAGARVEVAPYKRNPMDFVLWKPSADDLPGWDSPWGRGRPGWHIECSAMSHELLGGSFDIHGGGNDLMFPHHENEIAQSCCAHPEGDFARYWLHNEMLQVEGRKMAKSEGNFFTVRDLLEGNWDGGWPVPGEVIRFVFLQTHYRKPMDWTAKKAEEAERILRKWYAQAARGLGTGKPCTGVITALSDDLNTAGAIAECHQLSHADDVATLRHTLQFLGLMGDGVPEWAAAPDVDLSDWEHRLFEARKAAMKTKDFSEVDRLKAAMIEAGVEVRMSKTGVELVPGTGFDPAKLEGLE